MANIVGVATRSTCSCRLHLYCHLQQQAATPLPSFEQARSHSPQGRPRGVCLQQQRTGTFILQNQETKMYMIMFGYSYSRIFWLMGGQEIHLNIYLQIRLWINFSFNCSKMRRYNCAFKYLLSRTDNRGLLKETYSFTQSTA